MYFKKSFDAIMPLCAHRIILQQETFFQIIQYLNMPKINRLVSDSRRWNKPWLWSHVDWLSSWLTGVVTLPTLMLTEIPSSHYKVKLATLKGENRQWPERLLGQPSVVDWLCTIFKVSRVDSFTQVHFPDRVSQKIFWINSSRIVNCMPLLFIRKTPTG